MDLFGNAIFNYEGCEVKKEREQLQKQKQRKGEMTKCRQNFAEIKR